MNLILEERGKKMGNYEKYLNVFTEIFEISEEKAKTLEYQDLKSVV